MASTLPTPSSCCSPCDGLTVEVVTSTTVVTGDGGLKVCETLAALRAVASSSDNRYAILLGDAIKYDFGPSKQYYWDALSVDADNPWTVIVPNDDLGVGRWIEVL